MKSQIRREKGQLTSISLGFPSERLDAAYERARSLIKEWNIPNQDKLETWCKERRKDGGHGTGINWFRLFREETERIIGFDIRPDDSRRGEWYLRFIVGSPNKPK